MASTCEACGGELSYRRARFEIGTPGGRFIAEEVPSVECGSCGHLAPAGHMRPQLEAVLEVAEETPGAVLRKDYSAKPLHPNESGSEQG